MAHRLISPCSERSVKHKCSIYLYLYLPIHFYTCLSLPISINTLLYPLKLSCKISSFKYSLPSTLYCSLPCSKGCWHRVCDINTIVWQKWFMFSTKQKHRGDWTPRGCWGLSGWWGVNKAFNSKVSKEMNPELNLYIVQVLLLTWCRLVPVVH